MFMTNLKNITPILEEKLQKIYKQTKAMKYLYGNKIVEVIKIS